MESEAEAAQQPPPAKRSKVDDDEGKKIVKVIKELKKAEASYYVFQLHNLERITGPPIDYRYVHHKEFEEYMNMKNPIDVEGVCSGNVKHISHDEISKITKDFSECIMKHSFGRLFKGQMEGKDVLVRKWEFTFPIAYYYSFFPERFAIQLELLLNQDVFEHPKVAKLIGFCCEKFLALVYDIKLNRRLVDLIPQDIFTWDQRMSVARQVAETLEFFHSKKIALCNFFSPCINVDEEYNIQLFELDFSVNLANGRYSESFLWKDFMYYSPEAFAVHPKYPNDFQVGYFYTSDVYHFGLLLLELTLAKFVDGRIVEVWVESGKEAFKKATTSLHSQKNHIFGLALKCLERDPVLRPNMVEVVKEFHTIVPV